MMTLLLKDWRNLRSIFVSALLLGVPLLLILQFTSSNTDQGLLDPIAAYWIIFFFSSVALLYRSFALEHRSSMFMIYTALGVPRLKIFISQSLMQFVGLLLLGIAYAFLLHLFWPSVSVNPSQGLLVLVLASACLAPVGTLLGLLLQTEREFLFSIFFLPLCTPVILAAHSLCLEWSNSWLSVMSVFALVGAFISALLFEFFFDELSQTH